MDLACRQNVKCISGWYSVNININLVINVTKIVIIYIIGSVTIIRIAALIILRKILIYIVKNEMKQHLRCG